MKNLKCRNDSEEEKYETYKNFESTKWKSTLTQKIILGNETINDKKAYPKN